MNETGQPKQPSLPPDTTAQQDLTHAGQRTVNLKWETTQSGIALMVTAITMLTAAVLAFVHPETQIPTIMSTGFGMVVGFYFARTNHASIGGVGPKPPAKEYEGR